MSRHEKIQIIAVRSFSYGISRSAAPARGPHWDLALPMVDIRARLQALDSSQAIVRHFNGDITFWSGGMERLYGFTAE